MQKSLLISLLDRPYVESNGNYAWIRGDCVCTKLSALSVSVDSSNVDCFHPNTFTNSQNFALKRYLMAQILSHYLWLCIGHDCIYSTPCMHGWIYGKYAYSSALAPNIEHRFISAWISRAHSNLRGIIPRVFTGSLCTQYAGIIIVLWNFGSMKKENDELKQKLTEERKMWVKNSHNILHNRQILIRLRPNADFHLRLWVALLSTFALDLTTSP